MSTQDTLTAVTAVKDSVVDTVQAVLPVVQDTLTKAVDTATVAVSKVPTTGEAFASVSFTGWLLILLAFIAVIALLYIAIGVNRLAVAVESGKTLGSSAKTPASAPAAAPVAAPVATSIHPGLSDEKLAVLLAVATAEVLGKSTTVVKFRAADGKDWTWAEQGRVSLHTHKV